mgnify:CR=1 FL=1
MTGVKYLKHPVTGCILSDQFQFSGEHVCLQIIMRWPSSFDTLIVKEVVLKGEKGTNYVDRNSKIDNSRFKIGR